MRIDCERAGSAAWRSVEMDADAGGGGMKIARATEKYEAWLGRQLRIVPEDLAFKHKEMRTAVFPFLRATYYRWAQIWAEVCGAPARRAEGAGGGRPARGKLRYLAGHRRPADLGHQRFRRGLAAALHQRPGPPGHQRAVGGNDLRRQSGHRSHPQGLRGRRWRPAAGRSCWPSITPPCASWPPHRLHDPEGYWAKLHALPDSEKRAVGRRSQGHRQTDAGAAA